MLRLGLCCIFVSQPIRFRQATAKNLQQFPRRQQLEKLSAICLANAKNLTKALHYLAGHRIGAFRILTPLFPRYTHPDVGYSLEDLPAHDEIRQELAAAGKFGRKHDIRLSFHPDQFNVLSSPHQGVVANTTRELEYQGMLADMVGAEVINLHGGGRYGNKKEALGRLRKNFDLLPENVRTRLALENDDISFTPTDLLPVCEDLQIPFVYDVHHHRCLPDDLSEEEATECCVALWQRLGREPYFHISSPKNGWQRGSPRPHADYIDRRDFPDFWLQLDATVDVEAKAKELAVLRLQGELELC